MKKKRTQAEQNLVNNRAARAGGYYTSPAVYFLQTLKKMAFDRATTWQKVYQWKKPEILKTGKNCIYSPAKDFREVSRWYLASLDNWPGRCEGMAHDLIKLDHTGWYADHYYQDLIKSYVVSVRVPNIAAPGMRRRYYPATINTGTDGATVYAEPCDTAEEAARAADDLAEAEAEAEREYAAKDAAEQQTEEARAAIHAINRDLMPLITEVKRRADMPAPICDAIRFKISARLTERRAHFDCIATLTADYWQAVL